MMRDAGENDAGVVWARAGRRPDHDHMVIYDGRRNWNGFAFETNQPSTVHSTFHMRVVQRMILLMMFLFGKLSQMPIEL